MSKDFPNGVLHYTTLKGEIEVHFPEDEVKCVHCPYCRCEKDLGRYWCRISGELIFNPNSYRLGRSCPFEVMEGR